MRTFHGSVLEETRVGSMLVVRTAYRAGSTLEWHRHRRRYVSAVIEGSYTEVAGRTPRLACAGNAIVHEADEVHADHFQENALMINVELEDGAGVEEALRLLGVVPAHSRGVKRPAWLEAVLSRFDWVGGGSLKDAAAIAGVHPTHFARSFHRSMGVTAAAHRRRRRVDAASVLLLDSDRSLVRIAHATGFGDQSHFSNAFRRVCGMTPLEYRRAFAR